MRISYGTQADALYIRIADGAFAENKEVMPGVILDVSKSGDLLGIEILDASTRCPAHELARVEISMPLHLATSPASPGS